MNLLLHPQTQAHIATIGGTRSASVVLHGPRSMGKALAAADAARRLNCQGDEGGLCAACRQFNAGNYPDYLTIRPAGKPSIVIEQIRALVQNLSLSSYRAGGWRVVVIDDAHTMTIDAQNALLKLIEEPPPGTLFLLVTERLEALLPTVRSRCTLVYFAPLAAESIARWLVAEHGVPGPQASELALAAGGLPGVAVTLASHPDEAQARLELVRQAAAVPGLSRFDRLQLAGKLAAAKADLTMFGQALQAQFAAQIRDGALDPAAARSAFVGLERFRAHLHAKVAPRVALERLMLEL